MARSLKNYQGEDLSPVVDLTEPSSGVHVIWEESEFGGRAFKGESAISTFQMRDELGESGPAGPADGPGVHKSIAHGHRIEALEGSNRLFRGRIGVQDYTRGRQKADRAREFTINALDTNQDLRNIIVDGWARGAETDVARVQALLSDYLQGSPRSSTNISDTYVQASSNTVNLPARVYDATNPAEVLADIATIANKLHFVTVDDELFYDGWDSAAYVANVRISDRLDELNETGTIPDPSSLTAHPTISTPNGGFEDGDTDEWMAGIGLNTHPHASVDYSDPDEAAALGTYYGGSGTVGVLDPYHQYHGWIGETFTAGTTYTAAYWVHSTAAYSVIRFGDMTPGSYTGAGSGDYAEVNVTNGFHTISWTPTANRTSVILHQNISNHGTINIDRVLLLDSGTAPVVTFPPIWDVGPAATEDGFQQLSGLRLYYGQGSNTYVYVNDPVIANEYWHSEESLYVSDPAINSAARATTLANSILQRRKRPDHNINVSIGPLTAEQVSLLKPGQLMDFKARAVPEAQDSFRSYRIAQLKWTTPVPDTYFAHMMLDQPIKDALYGVGPKSATDSINRHVEQGSNSHPEYVLRGTLTSQGDLPYRGASDWTRLAIGSSNTHLTSDGIRPVWAAQGAGSGMTNPMTTLGDIIKGGSSGTPQRLAIGASNTILASDGSSPVWAHRTASSGGGSVTREYLGYNTIGGSVELMGTGGVFAKQITPANDCDLLAIDFYCDPPGGQVSGWAVMLFNDSSGSPGELLALSGTTSSGGNQHYMTTTNRWLSRPINYALTASTSYWIAVMAVDGGEISIAYDGSGSDKKNNSGGQQWAFDWANYSNVTNTSNQYSIRARVIR